MQLRHVSVNLSQCGHAVRASRKSWQTPVKVEEQKHGSETQDRLIDRGIL